MSNPIRIRFESNNENIIHSLSTADAKPNQRVESKESGFLRSSAPLLHIYLYRSNYLSSQPYTHHLFVLLIRKESEFV